MRTCQAWVGSFRDGEAVACGKPATALIVSNVGPALYVCNEHRPREPEPPMQAG